MGVHDRDWFYTNRTARPVRLAASRTTRPRTGDAWRLLRGFAIIAVAVLAVLVLGKTLLRKSSAVVPFGGFSAPAIQPAGKQEDPVRIVTRPAAEPAAPTQTYRCVVNGTLVYAGPDDCRPWMDAARRPEAEPPRTVAPPPDVLTPYQREMLRSADARIARQEAAARADVQAREQRAAVANAECAALAGEIVVLDAQARQANSAAMQDVIRSRRQDVRSRQFALRC